MVMEVWSHLRREAGTLLLRHQQVTPLGTAVLGHRVRRGRLHGGLLAGVHTARHMLLRHHVHVVRPHHWS